jgi:hypothetical protein
MALIPRWYQNIKILTGSNNIFHQITTLACDVVSLFIAIDQLVDLCNYRFRRVIGNDPCMYLVFILPATVCCVSLSTPSVNQLYFPAVTSQSINILSELMSVFGPLFDQDNQDLPSLELMMSLLPTIFFITAL